MYERSNNEASGSRSSHQRRRAFALRASTLVIATLGQAACATFEPAVEAPPFGVELGLPPGQGAAILARACTTCHNLQGLWAYQGYYNERRWRELVETMVAHGASVKEPEKTELVAYLVEHFGPGTRPAAVSGRTSTTEGNQ
jgi:hypothetical protein